MDIKEQYRRFRHWQQTPKQFSCTDERTHHCANCDHEYTGNYCPYCGQKTGTGRITWDAVRDGIMILWGMDSHSMPYTILQLMLRPGYLIGEYISGRRQVSYPPVKMLFIVAVIYVAFKQLIGIPHEPLEGVEGMELFIIVCNWLITNPGWGMITMTMILTIPTWFFFRFAPRHPRHTFPESVFIQLFMSTLMLISLLLSSIFNAFILLVPFYYYLAYRQLFGYRFWSTLWRLLLSLCVWGLVALFIASVFILFSNEDIIQDEQKTEGLAYVIITFLIVISITLAFGYLIGRWTEKKTPQKH